GEPAPYTASLPTLPTLPTGNLALPGSILRAVPPAERATAVSPSPDPDDQQPAAPDRMDPHGDDRAAAGGPEEQDPGSIADDEPGTGKQGGQDA
ncbi:MAG: hypothetical protein ACTHZK_01690, partial [Arthrobacter sp.]